MFLCVFDVFYFFLSVISSRLILVLFFCFVATHFALEETSCTDCVCVSVYVNG